MALLEKLKQCSSSMNCRFRTMFRLTIVFLVVGIALVLFFFAGDAS